MRQTRNLLLTGMIALTAVSFSACGGSGNSSAAEAEAAALPTDGILGELPKAEDAAGWAHLQKVVVMNKTSEAYKQAQDQIKAAREAFRNQGK